MKAYVLYGIDDLRYEETQEPDCPEGWAIVQVKAAGICSSDIPRIYTKGTYHFPTIPGHEFAGSVVKVGSVEDEKWIGKSVGVFPLIPCRKCLPCQNKKYEMCENYDYVGSRRNGGFAELVAVPVWNLLPLPPHISYEEGATLEPLAVALHAAKRGNIQSGDMVGVVGTGMIGFAAAQWAKQKGASKVFVIGRNKEKGNLCKSLKDVEYLIQGDNMPYFDVTIEAVGTSSAIECAIQQTREAGRVVLMGNPAGNITLVQNVYWRLLRKQISLTGTWNSSYHGFEVSDWTEVCKALKDGDMLVRPLISHIFAQEELKDGLELMKRKKEPYCKVMTIWNAGKK